MRSCNGKCLAIAIVIVSIALVVAIIICFYISICHASSIAIRGYRALDTKHRYKYGYRCSYRHRYSYGYIYTRHSLNHKELAPNTLACTYR